MGSMSPRLSSHIIPSIQATAQSYLPFVLGKIEPLFRTPRTLRHEKPLRLCRDEIILLRRCI